jgi:transcriptional regulator with GAF, ATPase, and Fis domain
MLVADILSAGMPTLLDEICASLPEARPTGLGVVRDARDHRALLVYADAFGSTAYLPLIIDLPDPFRPRASGRVQLSADDLSTNPSGLIESRLLHVASRPEYNQPREVEQIHVWPIAGSDPPARLVATFASKQGLDGAKIAAVERLGARVCDLCERKESEREELERLRRLEGVDRLLPALFKVLDVREIFDRLSAIARDVIPHDFATVGLFSDNFMELTLFAKTSTLGTAEYTGPMPYPASQTSTWLVRFVRDLSEHPLDSKVDFAVREGGKSSIRVAVRLDDRTIGALNFTSKQPLRYDALDLTISRRVADYVALAISHQRLAEAGRLATERSENLEVRVKALSEELDSRTGFRQMAGASKAWTGVLTQATKVASTDTTALLLGESGTGKEVVARFLHRASSRSRGPFIALNCAALPEQLLEAELFGYERGAYTGATQSKPGQLEQAAGGTLFLDEVGEMSMSAQAKFLRVLQEREFQRLGGTRVLRTDARMIAATNLDLQRAIAQGRFREDLFYRLHVFAIQLPPLRERSDDILPLSEAFLGEFSHRFGKPAAGISREAKQLLLAHSWPGNVRELRNTLERASILCDGGLIMPEHLSFSGGARPTTLAPPDPPKSDNIPAVEREMIERALQNSRFNKSKAARTLGLTRQQLYVRMRRYGLE